MASGFQWKGEEWLAKFGAKLDAALDRAAVMVQGDIISHFPSPPREPKKSGKGFKKNSSKAWKRGHPSEPGMIPHIQTGTLKRSINWKRSGKFRRRVGTGVKHGLWLEFGTRNMEPRPFLVPAIRRNKTRVEQIIAGVK